MSACSCTCQRSVNRYMSSTSFLNEPLKRSMYPFCIGLPFCVNSCVIPLSLHHSVKATEVNSGPLSLLIANGFAPLPSMTRSSTRMALWLPMDDAASIASPSRLAFINEVQRPNLATAGQAIAHKIHRPHLIDFWLLFQGLFDAVRQAALAFPSTKVQLQQAVHPIHPFTVVRPACPAKHRIALPEPIRWVLTC